MDCPECGAAEATCGSRFHECLALEFQNPAYGAVHHLTVTVYMLQHSSHLTRAGWLHERELLRQFIIDDKPPAFIRKQNKDLVDSSKRTFKIKSRDEKPVIARTTWEKTILDVRMGNAMEYCEDITQWAKSVLKDVDTITL